MKAISFEAIRNLLRTKKKSADDYGDASFKRSDSFKRISIRRSYLNRGRKRAIHASKSGAHNANQNGKNHVNATNAAVTVGALGVATATFGVQEPSSVRCGVEHKVPFSDHVNVQLNNNNAREPITISSRIEAAIQQNNQRCSKIDANIKNVKNKPSRESIRNSVDTSASVADERHRVQRRSSKSKRNRYDEVTTSTSCFVKAGSMLKKPIGTGLDVTAADSIERSVNARYSHRDPFYEMLRATDTEFDPNQHQNPSQKQRFAGKTRPKTFAPNDDTPLANRVCIQQAGSINNSQRSSDFVNFNDSNNDSIWSAPQMQHHQSTPVINKSTFNVCNQDSARNNPETEMPSFVIFKTFSSEQNASGYLETCFNNVDDESRRTKDIPSPMQNNTYTKKYNDIAAAAATSAKHANLSSRKGKGVVIQISDSGCNIDNLSHLQIKEALNKKVSRDSALGDNLHDYSEDETSLNGKFTFEIYKQIRTSKKCDEPNRQRTKFNYDTNALKTFDSHELTNLDTSESARSTTLNESFASMHICDKIDNNFFLEPDTHEYNDVNVIPYPLRIKTNPFTNQKEPYSVNLGRVWKQLNLGQDDQSLETSIEKSKAKNDSFRSISSHDSGFSLTLTKQKSLFNKKQNKKSKRKSKSSLTRDGQFKKLTAFQPNGVRRSKKNQFKPRISPTISKLPLKIGSEKKSKAKKATTPPAKIPEPIKNPCETFLDRYYKEVQQKLQKDDDKSTDYSFSQEISDLEAFFEEHLKRLKEYYLQKKRINDRTLDEICSKCEGKRNDTKPMDASSMEPCQRDDDLQHRNSSSVYINAYPNRMGSNVEIIPSAQPNLIYRNRLSYDVWNDDGFDFPYPDKRNGTNTRHKVRLHPMNEIRVSNELEYASLDFSNHLQNTKLELPSWNAELIDSLELEHLKNLTDDDFLKEKQSMIVNYNSAGEFLLDGSDDEYEDILNDDERIEDGVCLLCDKIQPECECSMNRKLANAYTSITPENILCNCMGALNAPMLKPNYAKNSKTVKKSSTSKSRRNNRKAKRSKRKKWYASKNHSLRREYYNVASKYPASKHTNKIALKHKYLEFNRKNYWLEITKEKENENEGEKKRESVCNGDNLNTFNNC